MKNLPVCYLCIFIAIFVSCTTQAARLRLSVEQIDSIMEKVIHRVKLNSSEVKKYFLLDENKDITVKADLAEPRKEQRPKNRQGETYHFEVIYDMKNFRSEVDGVYTVPFTVKSLETGSMRQDELSWKPRNDATGILLSFDDDYMEVWESNFDLFDRYNAKVTFFVKGEYCLFCTAALERGHDVGYHSLNHLNLPKVSREVFDEETLSGVQAFRNAGVPLTSFAYPFGLSELWMHEELLKSYKILRGYGVTFRLYNSVQIQEGYISSRAMDTILFKRDEDFEAAVDTMFRTIKFIGGDLILPLTTHDISDSADWGIKPHRLEYLLQSANDLLLNFYRFKDFE